jgi:hypothetical protein
LCCFLIPFEGLLLIELLALSAVFPPVPEHTLGSQQADFAHLVLVEQPFTGM